ncbi:peptidase [bacterium]|nr:peptidase [bacterium]
MRHRLILLISFLLIIIYMIHCGRKNVITEKASLEYMNAEWSKLTPVVLTHDISYLHDAEIQTIKLIIRASRIMDNLFLQQVYGNNLRMLEELEQTEEPNGQIYLDFFKNMFGPWNRLDEDHPFINTEKKPSGANYYPVDMTKEEFNNWLEAHPEDRDAFESNFTMIRRKGNKLVAIPYSEFFEDELHEAANILKQAAEMTSDLNLKIYLNSRAEAFLSNDYYQSDMDWMDLSGDIEAVIGPYEVYEDNLFGYKAAFESFVCLVDHDESAKLRTIENYLNDMEANLPIPDEYKNFERGASSPIKVVNELFTAGDTKAGIQTTAFNLPNDERVRDAKGSKKVMLKNVMNAKFEKCWIPIVNTVLAEKDLERVSFDGYFNHVLMHEISHGLGPGQITIDGVETTVNRELRELYTTIEECKADVLGVLNTQFLIDKKVLPKELENALYASYLGGMFRSIRFGIGEAHGGGVAIQLNYCLDKGAFHVESDGKFSVYDRRIKSTVRDLAEEILLIQAEGNYGAAKELIEKYRIIRPEVQSALDKLTHVPIDIRPIYPIENEIE